MSRLGKFSKRKKQPSDERLMIRLSTQEKKQLQKIADLRNTTLSRIIRGWLRDEIEELEELEIQAARKAAAMPCPFKTFRPDKSLRARLLALIEG